MIDKKFIQKLKKEYSEWEKQRRQIIALSNIVLHDSKRIIFSLHRGDSDKAKNDFIEVEKILNKLEKDFGHNRIQAEGSYRAAMEEYVEAKMFFKILDKQKIEKIKEKNISFESYLGGICDTTGELIRLAINQSSKGKYEEVENISKIINDIMAELVEFDMSGYLRTKYDQAKQNLRKIEQINYEINIRKLN